MEEEIELTDFFSVLWQKKKFIIITVIIFTLVAFTGTIIVANINKEKTKIDETQEKINYYAQTTFLVATSQTTNTKFDGQITASMPIDVNTTIRNYSDISMVNTYTELLKSKKIINNVKEKLDLDYDFSKSIVVTRISDSNLIAIIVENSNKNRAIEIANALMDEFVKTMSQTYFIDDISVIDKAYLIDDSELAEYFKNYIINSRTDLSNMLFDLKLSKIISTEHLKNIFENYILNNEEIEKLGLTKAINDVLKIQNTKSWLKATKYAMCSAILGLICSCGLIIVIEMFNPTIKNKNHIGNNVLGLVEYEGEKSIFDILRIKLEKNKVILITTPRESNKYSYISNNLAISFANMNKKTLLIDLTSNETTLLENATKKGLFDFIKNKSQKIDNYISKVNKLDLLLAGTENSFCIEDELLEDLLTDFKKKYDYVIINTNNILANSNSLQLAKSVKNTILVATQQKTTLTDFEQSKDIISEVDSNVLGTILLK